MRNVPKEVTEDLADALEELIDTVPTSDGDEIEKPLFDIDREAVRRDADEERPSKLRMRLVPATAKAAPEKKSAVRRPIRK
jgi:hypothetical protein